MWRIGQEEQDARLFQRLEGRKGNLRIFRDGRAHGLPEAIADAPEYQETKSLININQFL